MSTLAEVENGECFLDGEGACFQRPWDGFRFAGVITTPAQEGHMLCIRIPSGVVTYLSPDAQVFIINSEDLLGAARGIAEARRFREQIARIQHDSGEIQIFVAVK